MNYTVNKPDGTAIYFRSRDEFVAAWNKQEVAAGWLAKTDDATEWSHVSELLGFGPPKEPEQITPTTAPAASPATAEIPAAVKSKTMGRYLDAYRVARATETIGQALKVLAILLAGLCVIIAVAGLRQSLIADLNSFNGAPVLMGLVAAVAVGIPFYALGILVCAIGQVLKATLDTAVHTSPLFDKSDVVQIMIRH
jgi:hypothetical protein